MASEIRQSTPALIREHPVLKDAARYNFFQAVWLLSRLQDEAAPLGGSASASREPVLFQGNLSLSFPKSEIESATWREQDEGATRLPPIRMVLNFLNLYGVGSPLPTYYTEEMIEKDADDRVAQVFLDLFNHRFASLLYAIWQKYHYLYQFRSDSDVGITRIIYSLGGIGLRSQRTSDGLDWKRLLPLSAIINRKVCSVVSITTVVSNYFGGLPVSIEQFVEQKVVIDHTQWNSLGVDKNLLGHDFFLGSKVMDAAGSFRLHLGPLPYSQYLEFLPSGKYYRELRELMRLILTDGLSYTVCIKVDALEVPSINLSKRNTLGLGWSAWLGRSKNSHIEIIQSGHSSAQ